jgi:hypothetical protein
MTDTDLLPSAAASHAHQIATQILHRLADGELVTEAAQAASKTVGRPIWMPTASLYGGAAGSALAFSYAARACPESADHWWAQAHRWLKLAADSTRDSPLSQPGLSFGIAGIALAAAGCDQDDRYARTLRGLHTQLAEKLDQNGAGTGRTREVHEYDVTSGLAGILSHVSRQPADTAAQRVTAQGIERFVARCVTADPPEPDAAVRPDHREGDRESLVTSLWTPWRIPPENYGRPGERELYPFGFADLGLAHGVPGPLAALSRAWLAGHRAPGQRAAIRTLADQLIAASHLGDQGRVWPRVVPFDASGTVAPQMARLADPAYCYGAPGITSALLDAGDALDDEHIRAVAVQGFEAALPQLRHRPDRYSSGLCHGAAGAVLICRKFATQTSSAPARVALIELVNGLLSRCDPSHHLLVRDYKPPASGEPGSALADSADGAWLDSPGLLDGAAGVALALLSVATQAPPRWARALLVH